MIDITRETTDKGYKYTLNDTNLDYTNSIEFTELYFLTYFGDLDGLDNTAKYMLTTVYLKENQFDAAKTIADLIPFYKEN